MNYSTKMNDQSSRSHAIYTICLARTVCEVSEGGGKVRPHHLITRHLLCWDGRAVACVVVLCARRAALGLTCSHL